VAKLSALRVALIAILIVPATNAYGIEGTALLITGVYVFPMFPLDAYVVINSIEGSYRRFFTEIAYPLVASVIMFGAVVTVHQASPLGTGVLEFALLVVVGAAVYTAVVGLFAFQLDWGIEKNMKSLLGAVT
jgi:PST family polysaccharide transporter/lipopolysaccharide exporter